MRSYRILLSYILQLMLAAHSLADGLLAVDNPAFHATGTGLFVALEAFEGHDHNLLNNQWPAALGTKNQNVSILFARTELGVQWQNWRLSTLQRGDVILLANRDAANIAQQNSTAMGYDTQRMYAVDYAVRGFAASGSKISSSVEIPMPADWQLRGGLSVSVLRGRQLKQETITGKIVATNSTDLEGSALQNLSNTAINTSDPNAFNAPFGKQLLFSGEGYAADAGVMLLHAPTGLLIDFAVADIAGFMDWYNVPNINASLNTETKYYDEFGYANFNPTARSISRYGHIHQRLNPKMRIAASYPNVEWKYQIAADHTQGYTFWQTEVDYTLSPKASWMVSYDWHYGSVAAGFKYDGFGIVLRSDSFNLDNAKAFGLVVNLQKNW